MKTPTRLLVATLFAATAGSAFAAKEGEMYVGGSLTPYNKYNIDCTAGADCDRTGNLAGKITLGTHFNDNLDLELMAFRAGSAKGSLKNGNGLVAGSVRDQGLAAVGVLPLRFGDFALKGRLGLGYVQSKASFAAGGSQSKWSLQPLIGVGASYAINKQVSLTADYDRIGGKYGDGKANVGLMSVGVSVNF